MTVVKAMEKKKICVIGEGAVGKTSLIRRFVKDEFDDRDIITIGTKTSVKDIEVTSGNERYHLKLQIWDVLGTSSFANIQKIAFKGANGAFVVLDRTRKETLHSIDLWLYSLYKVAGEIPVIVLANKSDIKTEFGKTEIEKLTADYGFPYYFTSAKTGENVNDAFNELGEMIMTPSPGARIKPKLDMSLFLSRRMVPEPREKLTALEVEDMMVVSYCKLLKDIDLAMALFREQVKRTGMNFTNPTEHDLKKIVDYLIDAASEHADLKSLQKERQDYRDLIGRIE